MTIALPNESAEYRTARNALLAAEADLRARVEEVAALRRTLPKGGQIPQDYAFRDLEGKIAPISGLFGDHDTLVVYSLMFGPKAQDPCPMCSAFLDGLTGQVAHLTRKTAFAVVAQNTPDALAALNQRMGWQGLPLYSALDTTYQQDYLAETEDGNQLPILNVFQRDAQGIHHFWSSELFFQPSDWHPRHVDAAWPLWNILDLTPQGRGDFVPPLR
ncbi:DUF899 family protein [Ruegeria arenilitoris]|uniref:DUF899 family protein n=1 Tax=Ruegeria arenilitoris TaxID=1173585 RepID=UPI00148168C7|nr:DUF899 family protein [Ruegeria arenilitoris]